MILYIVSALKEIDMEFILSVLYIVSSSDVHYRSIHRFLAMESGTEPGHKLWDYDHKSTVFFPSQNLPVTQIMRKHVKD